MRSKKDGAALECSTPPAVIQGNPLPLKMQLSNLVNNACMNLR
ncbi:hypothetical protein [Klebsiella grimontii]|nr:hypothetical protein [Klebsiella grimontii]